MRQTSRVTLCIFCAVVVATPGLIAIVDSSVDWGTDNRVSSRAVKLPDLVPVDVWTNPSTPVGGQSVTISSQVKNQGSGAASSSFTNTLSCDGVPRANQTLSSLAAGATGAVWSTTTTLGPGYHTLTSVADVTSVIRESVETNNQLQKSAWWGSPDLVVTSIDVYQNGSLVTDIVAGEPFDAVVGIANSGDASAGASIVELRDTFDSTVTTLGVAPVEALGPGQSSVISISALLLTLTGNHVLSALADSTDSVQEANKETGAGIGTGETNNLNDSQYQVILEWLVMIYCPHEPVEQFTSFDLYWRPNVGPSQNVKVFSIIDQTDNWSGSDNDNTRVYELSNYNLICVADWGELNMGSSATLQDFMTWAITDNPARKNLLVFEAHGGGCLEGVGWDSTYDMLDLPEMKAAMSAVRSETGAMIDVMAFESCLMGGCEDIHQFKDFARMMVATESAGFGVASPVTLDDLIAYPSCDAEWLAATFVSQYEDWFYEVGSGGYPDIESSVAAVDLSYTECITADIEAFSQFLLNHVADYRPVIESCMNGTTRYDYYIDLLQFVELINQSGIPRDASQQDTINQIGADIDAAVIAGFFSGRSANSSGLTITFPSDPSVWWNSLSIYAALDFASTAPSWSCFLNSYYPWHRPVANFTYSVDHEVVSFDASSSWDQEGAIGIYSWDFGDGVTTSGSPALRTHAYECAGEYLVELQVMDQDGMWSDPYSVAVYTPGPNQVPIVAMTYEAIDLTVTFVDESTDPDGYLDYAGWIFGDGYWDAGAIVAHTYSQPGTYQITHTAWDDDGGCGFEYLNITVDFNSPPSTPGEPTCTPGDELDGTYEVRWEPSVDNDTFPLVGYWIVENTYIDGVWSSWSNLSKNHTTNSITLTRPAGSYRYAVCAYDAAHPALWSTWSQMTWPEIVVPESDTDPPVTYAQLSGTPGNSGWFTSEVSVALSASDESTIQATYYRIDSESEWTTYSGAFSISNDGKHTVYFYSVDSLGNTEDTKNSSVWVDQTPPTTSATVKIKAVSATVTLTASDTVSSVAATYYRIDGSSTWVVYTGAFQVTGKGSHTVYFYSVDGAGNQETVKTSSFTI